MRVTAVLVAMYALLFAVLALGFWAAPEVAAQRLHLEAVGAPGLSTLRGDLGGLFLALTGLCALGLLRRQGLLLLAAAAVLAGIVAGRLIGFLLAGVSPEVFGPLAVEVAGATVLVLHARALGSVEPSGRRGWITAGVLLAVAIGGAAALAAPPVQSALMTRVAQRNLSADNSALLAPDALRVAVCGSSAPLPSDTRAKACVAVMAGGRFYVVDVGPESVERLMQWGLPLSRIGGVLVTHFHSDHIGDLGELNLQTWAQGRPAPLPVYGGPGVEQVVAGFNEAYRLDQGYRTAHHGAQVMPAATWPLVAHPVALAGAPTPARDRTALVLDDGTLRITAIELDHGPIQPAYAYRFDYRGRSVVVSGDTKAHPPLARAAKGADLMLSEAIARPMIRILETTARDTGRDRVAAIMHDVQDYHVSPEEAADLANQADVKLLAFYHLLPAADNLVARRMFVRGVDQAREGDWTVADDGSLYTLPVGSQDIRIGRIGR
ncbi:MBL fold metallo-hydrolase [Phenylobacterium sp.]|uniref:MBL fold metallo-hydrolase n=1 Tax=Phenylobacterium sp. TaxID=1871053 RepID=UPI002BF5EE7F|nr:MBL fold metallo-hydrolase [Phenylobacterium sp.]HVI32677.1 MBL fold metallo-hydrolase [Phenylobacterium sp.]